MVACAAALLPVPAVALPFLRVETGESAKAGSQQPPAAGTRDVAGAWVTALFSHNEPRGQGT